MATRITLLHAPEGYRSAAVARFMWQLDEQRRLLIEGTRGLDVQALEWQPAPGMNTIGMLLAHIAFAEAHLTQVGILGEAQGHAHDVVGFTEEDEGLPLAPGAAPSPTLRGRDLAFFVGALERARLHTRAVARGLLDDDLEREVVRHPPGGARRVFNVAWVFYHLIEHEAGHRSQIALLRHLHQVRSA